MPSPTQIRGQREEDRAEDALLRAGYVIEARNWRGGGGEIDRIARHRGALVFVEIRSKKSNDHGTPAETVRGGKQRRLVAAALAYLAERPPPLPDVRFDVVSVVDGRSLGVDPIIEIIEDAFDAAAMFQGRSIPML